MSEQIADEIIEQVFQAPQAARLVLANIRGSVQVRPGETGLIHVRAVNHAGGGEAQHTRVTISQDEDGCVRAETRFAEGGWSGFFLRRPSRVDYTVEVPPACSVALSGVSNSASLEGVQGDIQINTVSGEVQLSDLSGSLKIHSVSGDVHARRLSGLLEMDTVSGDAAFIDSQLDRLQASTVSGDLRFDTPLGAGPYTLKSVSGDVHLLVPAETACSLQSDSLSGKVHSDLPISRWQQGARHTSLELQGGGASLKHTSVSGDLYLGTPHQATPSAQAGEADEQDHLPVLERIERGELSVQEALELLGTKG